MSLHLEENQPRTCVRVPEELLAQALIPFRPNSPPTLHGVPILSCAVDDLLSVGGPAVCLARNVLDTAYEQLEAAFAAQSAASSLSTDDSSFHADVLGITALCTPHLDGVPVTDAAVRHLALRLQADVVIFDPAELVKDRGGIFGEELCNAFWMLYEVEYAARELHRERENLEKLKRKHQDEEPQSEAEAGEHAEESLRSSLPPSPTKLPSNSTSSDSESESDAGPTIDVHSIEQALKELDSKSLTTASSLRVALDAVHSFVHMGGERSDAAKHRRILYLRDFPAFNKVFQPWVQAISAAASSAPNMIVVAGISATHHAEENKAKAKQRDFVAGMHTGPASDDSDSPSGFFASLFRKSQRQRGPGAPSNIKSPAGMALSVAKKFSPQLRMSGDGSGRFASLQDAFASAFIHRYEGGCLRSKCDSPTSPRNAPTVSFERISRICLAVNMPQRLRDVALRERRCRFMDANLHLISSMLKADGKTLHLPAAGSEGKTVQGSAYVKFVLEMGNRILSLDRRTALVRVLPGTSTLSDLVRAFTAEEEWRMQVGLELDMKESVSTMDPIVAQVLADSSLSKKEKELLECIVDPTNLQTTFEDVCVQPHVIEALRTTVSLPLFCPGAFFTGILASESSSGVLLYGPPGTGKTMACRAIAKECGVRMLQIQSSTIQRCLVGETEQLITSIFSLARRLGPCVVFIDELDAIFGSRDGRKPVWYTSALTEFMQEMDGLRSADLNREKGLIVIGATNRPQDLDHAIIRRLPRRILVDLPGPQERKKILARYLESEQKDPLLDLHKLATQTRLFSGSDLRHLVLAAAQNALKESVEISWRPGDANPVQLQQVKPRTITADHFKQARKEISASSAANHKVLEEMRRWGKGERISKDDC